MSGIVLDSGSALPLVRRPLEQHEGAFDERWLQSLLFDHPELVILDVAEPGAGAFVPLRRELPLARDASASFLDILGVTRAGRLALVEVKLWRNPEARRKVVAQAIEYAGLLRGLSYGDLTAKIRQGEGGATSNPMFEAARARWPDLEEATFVDAVSRSLARGDFHIVIAGDGIRSDVLAIAEHLNGSGLGAARLLLLEIQVWTDGSGRLVVIPNVPVRTEVIQHRVIVDQAGVTLRPADEPMPEPGNRAGDEGAVLRRASNRAFWQEFIEKIRFDHPEQEAPRHGGDNWVRVPTPEPTGRLTAYRSVSDAGVFAAYTSPDETAFFGWLRDRASELRIQSDLKLVFDDDPTKHRLSVLMPNSVAGEAQSAWLMEATNRLVTLLRTEASLWRSSAGGA